MSGGADALRAAVRSSYLVLIKERRPLLTHNMCIAVFPLPVVPTPFLCGPGKGWRHVSHPLGDRGGSCGVCERAARGRCVAKHAA